MNTTTRARAVRGPLRATTFLLAAGLGGTALLLAGCSQGSSGLSNGAASSASGGSARSAEFSGSGGNPAAPEASAVAGPEPARAGAGRAAVTQARRLIPAQSIIYTAQLTVQVAAVAGAARTAAGIATAAGGYVSSQQESIQPGQRAASASMQLKIPAAAYPAALSRLTTSLGTLKSVGRQATDVTQQVADVGSRVTSAQAAITQLRALLRRAGSVSGLLRVQEQINGQESALEALLAQQRALARETSYATVALQLVSHHPKAVKEKKKEHGFLAGLSGGWRALRLTVSWLLTVLGAALPFTVLVTLAGAIGYGGWRVRRRRSSPPPTAA
jgi:hypothetical protein